MEKITNNHFDKYNKVFEYFVLIGIPDEKIKGKSLNDIININPEILSYFPNVNNPVIEKTSMPVITQVIFPNKANYIKDIKDFTNPDIRKPCFEDYIVNTKPNNFYHCFSYIYDDFKEYLFPWHYGVFVFYEEIIIENKIYYQAKAMVLISKKPYYILFNYILNDLFSKYSDHLLQPEYITKLYIILSFNNEDSTIINYYNQYYFIENDIIFPTYDLNLGAFFSRFTMFDLLIIAEQFLKRLPIIIFSENIKILYPTYFTIMSLIYPLNITNSSDYYKFLVPCAYVNLMESGFSPICAIYANLKEGDLFNITKRKQLNCVMIDIDNEIISRYDYLDNGEVLCQDKESLKGMAILHHIINENMMMDINILHMIENDIYSLKQNDNNSYFNIDKFQNHNSTCTIRNKFFTIFTKILTNHIPNTFIDINEDSISIELNKENFLNNIKKENVKEFYDYFISTPSFMGVFQKCKEKDPNLRNFIILDELINTIKNDKNIIYFDCSSFNKYRIKYIHNKLEITDNNDKTINIPTININSKSILLNYITEVFHKISLKIKKNTAYDLKFDNMILEDNDDYKFNDIIKESEYSEISILMYEIQTFINLIEANTRSFIDIEDVLKVCYIVLLAIDVSSTEHIDDEPVKKFCIIFDMLFKNYQIITKYFSFVLSIIYDIILRNEIIKALYEKEFYKNMITLNIQPTFYIILKYKTKPKPEYKNLSMLSSSVFPDNDLYYLNKVTCINDCIIKLDDFIKYIEPVNMLSIKCLKCKKNDTIFVNSTLYFQDNYDPLIHPMKLFIDILNSIIINKSLSFVELNKLFEEKIDSIRLLLFYLNIYNFKI